MEDLLVTVSRSAFGRELKALRLERRLTLFDLQDRTGIKYSAISAIEGGNRAAGPSIASSLADGLDLRGEDRSIFLEKAALTKAGNNLSSSAKKLGCDIFLRLSAMNVEAADLNRLKLGAAKEASTNSEPVYNVQLCV